MFQRKDNTYQLVIFDVEDLSVKVLKTVDWRWPGQMALSPDGRYILYDFPAAEGTAPRDIFLLAADGSSEVALVTHPANDEVLGWTADGGSMLFASDRGGRRGAWLLPIADGKAQGAASVVKSELDADIPIGFSRDGSFFYGHRTGMQDVYTASFDAKHGKLLDPPEKLTQRFVGSNTSPAWSPDGGRLAYVSRRDRLDVGGSRTIVIRSMETSKEHDIGVRVGYLGHVRWGPNGRSLYFATRDERSRSVVFRLNVETEEMTTVVVPEPDAFYFSARVSPDGETLYYGATDFSDELVIRARQLKTGDEREVYGGHGLELAFDLSPDGHWIAMIQADGETRSVALQVVPAEGGAPRELLRLHYPEGMGRHPAWSAAGGRILFWKRRDVRSDTFEAELWSVPVDGGPPRNTGLSAEHPNYLPISAHPDGRQIAFTAGKNRDEIWVMEDFLPELRVAK